MTHKYPFYIKATFILLGLSLVAYILYLLGDILVPIALSLTIAFMLNPLVTRFEKWKIPHTLAIALAILLALIVFLLIGYFLASQIMTFGNDFPTLKKKFADLFSKGQQALTDNFNIFLDKQNPWLGEAQQGLKPILSKLMGTAFGT